MKIDLLTVGSAIFSFIVFLLVHFAAFRRVRPERLLRSLLLCVIAIMGLPAVLMACFCVARTADASISIWVGAAILSSLIQGLFCFVYVLCVFGPYETSVRMRLIREIAAGQAKGISAEELLSRYNPGTILELRLQRLVGSGDIIEKDGRYRIGSSKNFFFIFDAIAGILKRWIGR
jgi:hypothetical protein